MNIDIKLYSRDENDFIIPWAEKIGKELITMQYSVHNLFMCLDDNGHIDWGHSRIYYSDIPEKHDNEKMDLQTDTNFLQSFSVCTQKPERL